MAVSLAIEENVRIVFSAEDASAALAALSSMREPPQCLEWATARARVQIATLMLSKGDIELLNKAIKQSQVDWRDTLVAAGLGNADWPSVASSAGFTIPQGGA